MEVPIVDASHAHDQGFFCRAISAVRAHRSPELACRAYPIE
jgi:hypothetical protein